MALHHYFVPCFVCDFMTFLFIFLHKALHCVLSFLSCDSVFQLNHLGDQSSSMKFSFCDYWKYMLLLVHVVSKLYSFFLAKRSNWGCHTHAAVWIRQWRRDFIWKCKFNLFPLSLRKVSICSAGLFTWLSEMCTIIFWKVRYQWSLQQ